MRYLREGGEPGIFNLGNAVGTSVLEVADAVRRATGRDVPVEFAGRRDGDSVQLIASSDKARECLGWTPTRSDVDTIVQDAWAWRQAHPDGYAR
jgi:UDP-glucose 4-epimerase